MAKKPNYSFEKRQKELARQARKDAKKQRKLAEPTGEEEEDSPEGSSDQEPA